MNYDEKLECFLGESCVESLLVDRINNEYSHMAGVFERGIKPIDIPEMKKAAQFLLDKTYEHDKDQFNSLMECIGECPRVWNLKGKQSTPMDSQKRGLQKDTGHILNCE